MQLRDRALRACTAVILSFIAPLTAHGQLQRTFVASTGNDANACSRPAPCRNFAAAIAAAADGGEVVVLDSAGYGAVSIVKSITLVAPSGVYAGITGFSGSAITINAPSGTVVLRGLTINGLGGAFGITLTAADHVHIDDTVVSNFAVLGGHGLDVNGATAIYVRNSTFRRNYRNITIAPTTGVVTATFDNDAINDATSDDGAYLFPTAPAVVKAVFRNCTVSGNGFHGIAIDTFGATTADATVQSCTLAFNAGVGLGTFNAGTARISQTMVTGNVDGLYVTVNGAITSFGNNQVHGNGTDISGTITVVPQN